MTLNIKVESERIKEFCQKHYIVRLALFGSVLGDSFRPESDVDVLVVFSAGQEPGLMRLAALERELSGIFGRRVDLRTPEDLSRLFRNEVTSSAEVLYAA